MPDTVTKPAPHLDDETVAALTLFNAYLAADRERREHERAVRKAEKTKDDAAAAARKLNDRKAPATDTAAAEAAYREAVEALKRVRDGETGVGSGENGRTGEAAEGGDSTHEAAEATDDTPDAEAEDTDDTPDAGEASASVGVEAPVGDDDLAGDEPAGVTG